MANPSWMALSRRALMIVALCLLLATALPAVAKSPRRPVAVVGSIEVSPEGGLGRIEIHRDLAAVLQRDEGIVSLVDISRPAGPEVVGRFDDGATGSLDGDLAFSSDGKWLIYARQTVQFSRDGIHVIDISDPAAPALASYSPAGGTLRIAHHDDGSTEWVVAMDAIAGLVVYRFEPTAGVLVPVHVSPLPALKVGGPASGGIQILRDPILDTTLMYASTGRTGVEVFDFADPTNPQLLGAWSDIGLAEVEVKISGKKRTIYGASEYWFDAQQEPLVVQLDASKLDNIKQVRVLGTDSTADDRFRVQGMAVRGANLFAAHSELGLVMFTSRLDVGLSVASFHDRRNAAAGVFGDKNHTFDIEFAKGLAYVTDAATGVLTILRSSLF